MSNQRVHDYAAVLDYIIQYKSAYGGCSPTIRELMTACGIPSTSHAHYILRALERDGKIQLLPGARGIIVPGGTWEMR